MPNFGIKCFLGSFVFSLLAVFAATKGYFMLTKDTPQIISVAELPKPVQNIELYAQNDDTDRIYEKFKAISAPSQIQVPLDESVQQETPEEVEEYDDISDTLAFDGEQTGDIIYDPDEDEQPQKSDKNNEESGAKMLASDEIVDDVIEMPTDVENKDDDEIQIAEAAEAPQFIIPLKHTFGTSSIGGASVSSSAEDSPVAMASQDVKAQAEIKAEVNDDPWEAAAVANPYITKNQIAEASQKHKDELAALDKEKNSEAKSDEETKVAYKMMKNILIPIPDEIANDENLTPQLSYSAKNKKIDADLKNKQQAQERLKNEREKEKIDDAQSKSLSDSITDWFSQGNKKEKVNIVKEDVQNVKNADDMQEDEESAFSRLLGLKKKNGKNIIPSELKLSFQPNRAEISGQTLEWLHAFSQNAVKDDEVMVEIRIDGSGSYELQQKRLNLLYTIFANNGVNYDKINIIFTARDPNSFIIRNVKYALKDDTPKPEKKKSGPWY